MTRESSSGVLVRPFALPHVTEAEYVDARDPRFHAAGTTARTSSADDSIARVSPYLKDYGITRVANVTHLDRVGVPVHTALKPLGTTLSNGSGKGLTMEASKISAIMEAIEQTHWENDQFERVEATQSDLVAQGLRVTDGAELPLFKLSLWNERLPLDWTAGHDLVTGEEVWTPAEMVQANLRSRLAISTFVTSSNGLASGNNVFEAILSGLTEVVERDAIAMYRAEGNRETYDPAIDLDQLSARYGEPFHGLREQIERAELRLFVFDCTNEIGVPTYKAFVHDLAVSRAGAFGGYGTSLDPSVALCRAVTEALQSRGLVIAGSRDDQFGSVRDASLMHSNHHEAPPPGDKPLPMRQDESTGSIVDDVAVVARKLSDAGMDRIVVLRHTSPGDPVQVVRVIVPRLEGYRFEQYTPGPRARAADRRFLLRQQEVSTT